MATLPTAVVTKVVDPKEGYPPPEGGIPSVHVVLTIVRAEITQTT
jgi:hypothetical protein